MTTTKLIRNSSVLFFLITSGYYNRTSAQTDSYLSFNASYIGDWVTNFHEAIKMSAGSICR